MLKDGLRFPVAINPVRFPATSYQPLLSLVPHGPILGILSRILPLSHAGAEEGAFSVVVLPSHQLFLPAPDIQSSWKFRAVASVRVAAFGARI